MIDGKFLLETMHGECYPNHPLGKHMLLIVLFVKARGENQYIVTEYSINHFFSVLLFQKAFFYKHGQLYLLLSQCCWDLNIVLVYIYKMSVMQSIRVAYRKHLQIPDFIVDVQ